MALRMTVRWGTGMQAIAAAEAALHSVQACPKLQLCKAEQLTSLAHYSGVTPGNQQQRLQFHVTRSSSFTTREESTAAEQSATVTLVLYSKPECHLCDGLKEKVNAALVKAKYLQSELSGAILEVRDITTKPEWEQQYGLVIPVLTAIMPGTNEEIKIPRVPPRSTADRVATHIIAALPK